MSGHDWDQVAIREAALGIFDGPHATPKKTTSGPVFLGISSLSDGRLDLGASAHLSEEDFVRWTRRVTPRPGDIVFSYETRLGQAAIVPEGLRCCLGRRMALVRPDPARLDSRFFLYQYLSPDFQDFLRSRTVAGSTVDRILLTEFPDFPISLPPLAEQRAIAGVLGTLDDKIEANRTLNETLEATCQALFRSWFVDFDPVVAKSEGRRPAHLTDDVATLFPDRLEDSPIGPVPAGWKVGCLADVADLTRDGLQPKDSPLETFLHFSIPAFDVAKTPVAELGGQIRSNKFLVPSGAVLLSKLNPHIPRIWLPDDDREMRAVASTEFLVMKPSGSMERCVLYGLFSSQAFLVEFSSLVTGTSNSHQRVKPEDFLRMPIVVPDEEVVRAAEGAFLPMIETQLSNLRESHTLAALRDALLPRLLSGELWVREAEQLVEEAV
ncbi:MAG: restriction endonuclease subunit S [Gemmatimonadota bacterium]